MLCWVAGLGGPEVGWEVGLERVTGVRESQDFERQLTDLVEAGMITLILAGRWGAVAGVGCGVVERVHAGSLRHD